MAPSTTKDIVLLQFTYRPELPKPRCEAVSPVNQYSDFHPLHEIISWVNDVVRMEKDSRDLQMRYHYWDIKLSDPEIFEWKKFRYDNVCVMLCEDRVYWIFYTDYNLLKDDGVILMPLKYCPCCMKTHYLELFNTIKEALLVQHYSVVRN